MFPFVDLGDHMLAIRSEWSMIGESEMAEKKAGNGPQQRPSRDAHLGEAGSKGMVVVNANPVNVVPSPKVKPTGNSSTTKK